MTDTFELNINTFCPLDCNVPTFEDSKGNTTFIVRHDLYDALGLPEGFNHEEHLAQSEWERRMPNYASDDHDAWQIISESGFYKLVLMGNAAKAKAVQAWITGIVLPTLQADGLYMMGEELRFERPENVGIDFRKHNDVQGVLREYLTRVIMPELRRDQIYMVGIMDYLNETGGGNEDGGQHEPWEKEFMRRMEKKAARGKPTTAMLH
jgi:hypothetical protein